MRRELLLNPGVGEFLAAASGNSDVMPVVWFTGIDVLRYDWTKGPWMLRLPMDKADLSRFNAGAPLFKAHTYDRSIEDQVGVIQPGTARIDNGRGVADVKWFTTQDAAAIRQKVEQGARNVSMEISVEDLKKVPKGESKYPVYEATAWQVEALALAPVPADQHAQFMSVSNLPDETLTQHLSAQAGASSRTAEDAADHEARMRFAARILRGC